MLQYFLDFKLSRVTNGASNYCKQWYVQGHCLGNYGRHFMVCLWCWDMPLLLCIVMETPSGEGSSAVPLSGHRCGDEKPPAEVFAGPRFLLPPGVCGGRQPSRGHPCQTPAGHHQEAGTAGNLLTQTYGSKIKTLSQIALKTRTTEWTTDKQHRRYINK